MPHATCHESNGPLTRLKVMIVELHLLRSMAASESIAYNGLQFTRLNDLNLLDWLEFSLLSMDPTNKVTNIVPHG